jgi:5-methylcytosine-specific restriction endonuclease McrA
MNLIEETFVRWFHLKRGVEQRDPWSYLLEQAARVPWDEVAKLAATLDYKDHFLRTAYWQVVSSHVKELDQFTCQRCECMPGIEWLEVHHKAYEDEDGSTINGKEHEHLDLLETLCVPCHRRAHGLLGLAVIAELDMQRAGPGRDRLSESVAAASEACYSTRNRPNQKRGVYIPDVRDDDHE